jgi:hypothetical protein
MSERWQINSIGCPFVTGLPLKCVLLFFLLFPLWGVSTGYAYEEFHDRLDPREPFLSAQKKMEMEQALKEADFADHLMADWMLQLMNSIDLHSVESLVFGSPGEIWWDQRSYGKMLYGTFHEQEVSQIIQPTVQMFLLLFVVGLCGAILYSTLKIGANPHNPNTKYEFAENIKSWFISGIFFASYPTILDLIFGLNESIRMTFYEWSNYHASFSYIADTTFLPEKAFGSITLAFVEFIIVAYLNFIYLARKFVLMLLIVIGPVIGICLFYTRLRSVAGTWFREMIGNIFIQSIHAILLFMMVSSTGFMYAGPFAKLAWLFLLIPVSGMIGQWLGLNRGGSQVEQKLHYIGLGSISGMSRLSREGITHWRESDRPKEDFNEVVDSGVLMKAGTARVREQFSFHSSAIHLERRGDLMRDDTKTPELNRTTEGVTLYPLANPLVQTEVLPPIKKIKYGDGRKPSKLL